MEKSIQILKQALGPFIAFHAVLGQICESATAGLMLSRAISLSKMPEVEEADGWFYHTMEQWEQETCLTRSEQESARKRLKEKGLIEEKVKGVPPKVHFRICWPILEEVLLAANRFAENPQINLRESDKLICGKPANPIKEVVDAVSTSKKEEGEEPLAPLAYPKPQKKEKPKPWERQRSQRSEFTPLESAPSPCPTGPTPRPDGWGEFVKVYQEELDTLPRYRSEDGANFEFVKAELGGLAPVLELFRHWVFAKDSRELNKNDYAVRDFLDGGWRDVRHRLGKPIDGSMTEEETRAFYKKYTGTYPGEKSD